MEYYLESGLLITSEAIPVVIGLCKYGQFDRPLRIFFFITLTTFLTEVVGLFAGMSDYKNNLKIYNVSSLIIMVLLCLYFNYCIDLFRRLKTGFYLAVVSLVIWVVSVRSGGGVGQIHPLFLYFQNLIIILLGLVSIYSSHKEGTHYTYSKSAHFWISILIICSGCTYFIEWGLYDWLLKNRPAIAEIINAYLTSVSYFVNIGISMIFIFYQANRKYALR